ncbi:MAG: hypothetical protein K0V04_32320, partial [Deltaproteobacteria bacterium]|nr:hypothetical protein [Deltaproteobacteria bacterium]
DPFAVMQLQRDGKCEIRLPEALFELDHRSHYMRRLRSVRLTVVGTTGPYDAIGATLTMTRSEVRTSATAYDDPAQPVVELGGAAQSIATSTGQSDAGLFEVDGRDARYLPFEGRGAASHWTLQLPQGLRTFDYSKIADVVLEVQYTAREGGAVFAGLVEAGLAARLEALEAGSGIGTGRMWAWSLRSRFPTVWSSFVDSEPEAIRRAELSLSHEHYPYPLAGAGLRVVEAFVVSVGGGIPSGTTVSITEPGGQQSTGLLGAEPSLPGVLVTGPVVVVAEPAVSAEAYGNWVVEVDAAAVPSPETLDDLVLVVRYTEGA